MSESVFVTAALLIAKPRLQTCLRSPVAPANAWSPQEWAGVSELDELPSAIDECDSWLDGDYADVFLDLAQDDLTFQFDEDTGSLVVEFSSRADFRLPTMIWAVTLLRGVAGFMADGDHGLVTVTNEWSDDTVLLHLAPDTSTFLDRRRDARAYAEAKSRELDIQAAAGATDDEPRDVIDRLLND
ncbi:hypothetical protein ACFPIJ_17120 [Dactylosporangium cerinum]|uniref:Uncharacterized protein n=1 Tax=Dactylosporangium cerinum TaxID=1434730 RepID=A0ABV9VTA3_9ACTN